MNRFLAFVLIPAASLGIVRGEPIIPGAEQIEGADGGRVLIDALNCSACHDISGFNAVAPLEGPRFTHNLSIKYDYTTLRDWIADPHKIKPGTRMPDVVESPAEAEALAQFLYFSLPQNPSREPLPNGDLERGKEIYHSVGCVACHAPDGEKLESPSVPIELAKTWLWEQTAEYLLDPGTAAMPDFRLSPQDASDLASYILRDVPHADANREIPERDSGLAAQGAVLFMTRGCAKCHGAPPGALARGGRAQLRKLIPASLEKGCLADEVDDRAPNFHLSENQREAIRQAVIEPAASDTPIERTLAALNCLACHQRGEIGGPAADRKPFFAVTDDLAKSIGDLGNIPPRLDHVGRKLTPTWLQQLLDGEDNGVRPYMATKMPHFRHEALEKLDDWLAEADTRDPPIEMDTSGLRRHHRGHYGRDLLGIKGVGCITCHGLKSEKALGSPAIDLTHTVDRLQPGYFKEILLNPAETQP
ncbi:MAG: mono/diheme cytochrome c family protein, partial [Verrucomicrobiales bacterium]